MAHLVLVRHGQSEGNVLDLFAGDTNFLLTDLGRKQAVAAGRAMKDIKIDRAFTSALVRTHQTLQGILEGMGIAVDASHHPELNERSWGVHEGMPNGSVPIETVELWRTTMDQGPVNGETFAHVKARLIPFFEDKVLPDLMEGKSVLLVGHGAAFRLLRKYLEKKDTVQMRELGLSNCEIVIYEVDAAGHISLKERRIDHIKETLRKD